MHGDGPGFVPDFPDATQNTPTTSGKQQKNKEASKETQKSLPPLPKRTSSVERSNSLSLGALRPSRLSVRLPSRPKPNREGKAIEKEPCHEESKKADFAYKPIQQDYTAEVIETSKRNSVAPFRYVPTNARYLEDKPASASRSRSAGPYQYYDARRSSFSESLAESYGERDQYTPHETPVQRTSRKDEKRKISRFSISNRSDCSSPGGDYEMPPRRRTSPFVASDRKRGSLLRPMTLTMVPDSEDLF